MANMTQHRPNTGTRTIAKREWEIRNGKGEAARTNHANIVNAIAARSGVALAPVVTR